MSKSDRDDINGPGFVVGATAWLVIMLLLFKDAEAIAHALAGLGFLIPAGALAKVASDFFSKK